MNLQMNLNNNLNSVKSPPPTSENHSYVNLNQTHSGARMPSYNDSNLSSNHNSNNRPIPTPRPSRDNLEINANLSLSPKVMPPNWFSPASSIASNSRPTSIADSKVFTFKNHGKVNQRASRPMSLASSNVLTLQPKQLRTIDEDVMVLPMEKLLELCSHYDEEIQSNAFGYLQHITFNNPEKKMEVREYNGLPVIVDEISSNNNYVARSSLGVLKNVAFTNYEMITTEIANLGAIQKLADIIEYTDDDTKKELAIDVIWNLSVKQNLKPTILLQVIPTLMKSVIIPDSMMICESSGNYVHSNEDIVWSTMLRNALGIIRNISYDSYDARATLRDIDGLIDCILYIIFRAGNSKDDEQEEENQIALIDTKIVENCVCILRNLTYAIQEIVDPEYLEKRRENVDLRAKKTFKGKNYPEQTVMIAPKPVNGTSKGSQLLWDSKYLVSALFPILQNGANAVTLEAAAGVTQNLTAGDWEPSKEMQIQFRLQLALPSLIELVDLGTTEVIKTSATALRNLVQDNFCRMLVGKNGLKNLTEKIPLSNISKKVDPSALAALLSTIYVIICDDVVFMKDFIMNKGAKRCIYVKDSDEFLIDGDNFPDKVRIFSHCILDLLWKKPETQEMLKKANVKQTDINIPTVKTAGGGSISDAAEIARKHESIVSNGNEISAQYPRDERYIRDSYAETVSNSGLRDRNSRVYNTSSVPGYGDIRVAVSGNIGVNGRLGTIQSDSRASSIQSNRSNLRSPALPQRDPRIVSASNSRHTSRIASDIGMQPIHGKISVTNRRPSNNPSGNTVKSGSRPLPKAYKSNQRSSTSTNNSEMYNYEYSKPNKPKPIAPMKRISNSGV